MTDPKTGQESEAPSKVNINGVDYDPQEAADLIGLGSKTRENEQKWNTTLDKVWPEYGKLSSERSQWQTEKQKLESQITEFQTKQQQGVETPVDVKEAREAAKKLGLVLDDDLKQGGYIKKEELDAYLTERTNSVRTPTMCFLPLIP